MTQRLEKCLCVKCYSSVKPQSDRLVEDKQAHTSHKMKNAVKSFCAPFYWFSISNLGYTRGITQKLRATSGEDHLRNLARELLSFELRRNVASHWRWPWTALYSIWQVGYWTPDLWLWKQYRYCHTNQPITNPSCGRTCTSKFTRQIV